MKEALVIRAKKVFTTSAKRRVAGVGAVAAVLVGATTALASASIPADDGVINGCYVTGDGQLRVIDADTQQCKKNETPMHWNQQGPQGPVGPQGPQGQQGAQGEQGEPGADGQDGADGARGPAGSAGPAGPAGTSDAWFDNRPQAQGVLSNLNAHEVAAVNLPAGSYVVTARTTLQNQDEDAEASCVLRRGTTGIVDTAVNMNPYGGSLLISDLPGHAPLTLTAVVTLPGLTKVNLACSTVNDGVDAFDSALTAIKVTSTH